MGSLSLQLPDVLCPTRRLVCLTTSTALSRASSPTRSTLTSKTLRLQTRRLVSHRVEYRHILAVCDTVCAPRLPKITLLRSTSTPCLPTIILTAYSPSASAHQQRLHCCRYDVTVVPAVQSVQIRRIFRQSAHSTHNGAFVGSIFSLRRPAKPDRRQTATPPAYQNHFQTAATRRFDCPLLRRLAELSAILRSTR